MRKNVRNVESRELAKNLLEQEKQVGDALSLRDPVVTVVNIKWMSNCLR